MQLSPREKDKLLVAMAAMVARKRLERGVKLNYPEAIALITDFVVEGARDGRSVAEAVWVCTGPLAILERDMWTILVLGNTPRRDRYSLYCHANLSLPSLSCGLHHRSRDRPHPVQPLSALRGCSTGGSCVEEHPGI